MKFRIASLIFCAAVFAPAASQAQTFFRTFVSGLGADTNPCTRTQPCQTFTRALAQTFSGGEIDVLDPGGYGPFTIDRAISIVNDGVGVVGVKPATSASAIVINATPSEAVYLRGLTIEGAGQGTSGIVFNSGRSLTVTKSTIRNFLSHGVAITPNSTADVNFSEVYVTNNAGDGFHIQPTSAGVTQVTLNHVESNQNTGNGINVNSTSITSGALRVLASDCVSTSNSQNGFLALGTSTVNAFLDVYRCAVNFNGSAGFASGNGYAIVTAGQSWVLRNVGGPWSGSFTFSFGDNYANSAASQGVLTTK